ncbi:MAG: aminotransferase class V-fold PLP-dependent enzyme [Oryzihumus sp.]
MSIATISRTHHQAPAPAPRDHLRPVPALPQDLLTPLPRTVAADLGVPTLHRTVVDYANFDHAASTPALESVQAAVDAALRTYSSVHRGNGYASKVTSAWYEQAREQVASFVGAREEDLVVFTRNTTDSLNLLARALPRRTTTFVFESEHHAALLPWDERRTVRLPVPGSVADALVLLEEALAEHARSSDGPRLVVVTGASNVTGELWPVERVTEVARRYAARVALDAAQLAPHRRINLDALDVDYVAFSGHKLYAPFGAGVLVGRADWLDAAAPYLRGGGATARVSEREVQWSQGAARHEAGSPNVIGAIALAAACATVEAHRDAIEAHESALAQRLQSGLAVIEGVTTWSVFGEEHDRVGVVTFTVDGVDSSLVSASLSAEHGIGVRDGKFCAHLLVDALLDGPGAPATAVRASVGLANTLEHVDRLVSAVRRLAEQGPAFDYALTDAGWEPVHDPRDLSLPRPW